MKNIIFSSVVIMGIIVGLTVANSAKAASTTGNAIQTVIAALSIANTSDLDFGSAPQGDGAKTVAPGAAEAADNGSFTVTGQPNTAYSITLPADGVVSMTTAGGGVNKTIAVDTFVSSPVAGVGTGLTGVGGTQLIFVGATRAALGALQVTGAYLGTYTVTVVY